jgi:signal transduction histidine kinase
MIESGSASLTADILVVDDTPDNIRFLSSMLTESGYSVRPAISGKIALRAAQSITPDLILLDINMPEMDGYQVCQILKSDPTTQMVPVIFLSALSDVKDKVKAFQMGGSDYISKPFQMDEVLARISNQLTIRQLQKEVESRNAQLETALTDLKSAQLTLIQNEKMTALGQLVAGIAHEINNPVSFIYGNLPPAMNYVQDLVDLLSRYQQAYPQPVPEIAEQLEELDIEFLTEDLAKIMTSMQTGANRIRKIVVGLRSFSRLDESGCKVADVVEGLESTLEMVRSRLEPDDQPAITLVKQYDPIPAIACYPAQLNQVFFHLLVNAIDAIRSRLAQDPAIAPQITLTARQPDPKTLEIAIADNGIGMDEQTQTHLFNPFFSAKPIGQGTGLGLSICYQVIHDTHQGEIKVTSQPGQGATFTIHLPTSLPVGNP